ncbi:MAG: hypothetical protein ACE5I7_11285 [Candidatus Binatia bacterium]
MEERYPYIRFVLDAAQLIAGAVGVIILLSGLISSCHHGGFGGFVAFLITLAIAGVAYVAVMVWIESLRVFLDIESSTRRLLDNPPQPATATPPPPPPPPAA